MTHKDIFTKFMIEYDKANITSSYPSLTEYEIATVLDKAYLALISQKVTGNNVRRAPFEADVKSIFDLQPLVTNRLLYLGNGGDQTKAHNFWPKTTESSLAEVRSMPDNMRTVPMPHDMLYFVSATVPVDMHTIAGWQNDEDYSDHIIKPMDNKEEDYKKHEYKRYRLANVNLMPHQMAKQFYASSSNIPWIKNPVCFLEDNRIFLLIDPIAGIPELTYNDPDSGESKNGEWMQLSYIKTPHKFAKDLDELKNSLKDKKEDIEATYSLYNNTYLYIYVDRYLGGSKNGAIHINGIRISDVDEQYFSSDKERTFYVEYDPSQYDPSTLKASQFSEGQPLFGNIVRKSSSDDSFKLNSGNSVAIVWKEQSSNSEELPKCSRVFVLTYDDIYRMVKSQIIDKHSDYDLDWTQYLYIISENASEEVVEAVDEFIEQGTSEEDPAIAWPKKTSASIQLVPLDASTEDSSDDNDSKDQSDAVFDNVISWSYSEYKLQNKDVKSGSLLKDKYGNTLDDYYTFELNDVAAEELISLAISYALENVESSRLNAHLGMRGLES